MGHELIDKGKSYPNLILNIRFMYPKVDQLKLLKKLYWTTSVWEWCKMIINSFIRIFLYVSNLWLVHLRINKYTVSHQCTLLHNLFSWSEKTRKKIYVYYVGHFTECTYFLEKIKIICYWFPLHEWIKLIFHQLSINVWIDRI